MMKWLNKHYLVLNNKNKIMIIMPNFNFCWFSLFSPVTHRKEDDKS